MVRAASRHAFFAAKPCSFMRLRGYCSIKFFRPYERTGRDGVAEPLGMQRRVPKNHPGYKGILRKTVSERKRCATYK